MDKKYPKFAVGDGFMQVTERESITKLREIFKKN